MAVARPFVASAFAKTSLCTALAVQALAETLVGPQTALFVAVALAVGGQDGLVQGCLGKVITLGKDPTGCLAEKGTVVALFQEILLRGRRVVTSCAAGSTESFRGQTFAETYPPVCHRRNRDLVGQVFPLPWVSDTLLLLLLWDDKWDELDHLVPRPRIVKSYAVLVLLVVVVVL